MFLTNFLNLKKSEIVRIRNEVTANAPSLLADFQQPVEIFRHCATGALPTADTPAPVSVAEVIRHKALHPDQVLK